MRTNLILALLLAAIIAASATPYAPMDVEAFHRSRVLGEQNVIVIPARFVDVPNAKSRDDIRSLVFGQLNSYLREASYGQAWLQGDVTPWYDLPKALAEYRSLRGWKELISDSIRLADQEYDLTKYSLVVIVHSGDDAYRSRNSRDMPSFATSDPIEIRTRNGVAKLPVAVLAELDPVGPFAHHILFAWGIPVLWIRAPEGAKDLVGEWDVMGHGYWAGNGSLPAQPGGWVRLKLGWINGTRVKDVAIGETATIRLDRLEIPSSGVQLIRLPVSEKVYYLVELRARIGFDKSLPSEGVLVSYVDETKGDGEGPVRVMSSNPDNPDLYFAAHGKDDFFQDVSSRVAVFVVSTGQSYVVKVDRTDLPQLYKVVINTPFKGLQLKVDGKAYNADSSGKARLALARGPHWIEVQEVMGAGKGVRYQLKGWSDGATAAGRSLSVNSSLTLTLTYRVQYLISVNSPFGEPKGSGWYEDGSKATYSIDPYIELGNQTRMRFHSWIGDVDARTPEATVLVNGPKNIFAYWKREYLLSLSTSGLPAQTPVELLINGQAKQLTENAQEWVEAGSVISLKVAQVKISTSGGTFVFRGWQNSTGGSISDELWVRGPTAIVAAFQQERGFLQPPTKGTGDGSKGGLSLVGEMKDAWRGAIDYFLAKESSSPAGMALRPLAQIAQWTSLTYDILSPVPWASAIATPVVAGFLIGVVYLLPLLLMAFGIARAAGARRFGTKALLPLSVVWLLAVIPIMLIPLVPGAYSEGFTILSLAALLSTTVILTALAVALKVVSAFSR